MYIILIFYGIWERKKLDSVSEVHACTSCRYQQIFIDYEPGEIIIWQYHPSIQEIFVDHEAGEIICVAASIHLILANVPLLKWSDFVAFSLCDIRT